MKTLLKLFILTLSFTQAGYALAVNDLYEGSFEGTWRYGDDEEEDVNLLVKPITGREGSFRAILISGDEKLAVYQVNPEATGRYTMTPYSVGTDGEIGIVDDNPSLTLTASTPTAWHDEVNFVIVSANSGNNRGFTGTIRITDTTCRYRWIGPLSGTYDLRGGEDDALTMSQFDSLEGQAFADFASTALSGSYIIREKMNGLFAINVNRAERSGTIVERVPQRIGLFIERRGLACTRVSRDFDFVLVSTTNDTDILTFRRLRRQRIE